MCKHQGQLERCHRSFWQKIIGIKATYRCKSCGQFVKVK